MKKIFQSLAEWHEAGLNVSLAIVVKTWGSAPRRKGSLMAIAEDGRFEGSVSGGCVEGAVISEAIGLMPTGGAKLLSFTVASEDAWQVGLACGGQIEIQLVSLAGNVRQTAAAVIDALETRTTKTLELSLRDGAASVRDDALIEDLGFQDDTLKLPVRPQRRLFIIGAVHIAQHLAPMAQQAAYDVTVIDPRAAFTESRQFGEASLIEDWPDDVFRNTPPDEHTAVVALTHDPKIDDAALLPALESPAFYIGALGSKKTQASRLSRLGKAGATTSDIARIHGPIGLDIGAANPAEIAISILAEMTKTLRKTDAI